MVFRPPLAPIVTGLPMSIGGAQLLEVVQSVIYAVSVVLWAWAARPFGRVAALTTAVVVLVLQLPYAALFHLVSSDFVFGALVPVWAGFAIRSALAPRLRHLVGLGLAAAALTLARPAGGILLLTVAAAALLGPGSARSRLLRLAPALVAVLVPLLLWAAVNDVRFGDFTVTRGGKAWVPFFKVFGEGKIDAANGPASRRLAHLVERDVLTIPLYRRDHVDARTYFRAPSNFETIRLIALVDRDLGRANNYDLLFDASNEAIRKHPGWFAHSVGKTFWDFITQKFALDAVHRHRSFPSQPAVGYVAGKPIPRPIALTPMVDAARFGFVWCPTEDIDRCIFRDPARAFPTRREQRRYVQLTSRVRDWNAQLPVRDGRQRLAARLDTLSSNTPPSLVWIAIALVALLWRRPRGGALILVLVAGGALVLLVHALSQAPQSEFALPLAPLFALTGIAAVLAPREEP
jgi:hypothetical protein